MTLVGRAGRARDRAVAKARKTTASTLTTTATTTAPRKRQRKTCPFIDSEAKEAKEDDRDADENEDENENENDPDSDFSSQEGHGDDDNESRANPPAPVNPGSKDDLLAQMIMLAERMPRDFRAKFDALFETAKIEPATPIIIDEEETHETTGPRLPDDAKHLSEFVEVPVSGAGYHCAFYTLLAYLQRFMRQPYNKTPAAIRAEHSNGSHPTPTFPSSKRCHGRDGQNRRAKRSKTSSQPRARSKGCPTSRLQGSRTCTT